MSTGVSSTRSLVGVGVQTGGQRDSDVSGLVVRHPGRLNPTFKPGTAVTTCRPRDHRVIDERSVLPSRLDPTETKSPCESLGVTVTAESHDTCLGRTGLSDQELSQVFRHSGWAGHRRLVYQSLQRTRQSLGRVLGFWDCGAGAYVLKSTDDPPRYRVAGSSCHDRFCNPCATARARVIAQNVIDRLAGVRVRFITFTLRHSTETLAELLDRLYASFRTMQRTRLWRDNVKGGVGFLEVKHSDRSDGWHPHFHVLVEGKYIDKKALQRTWHDITGDSFIVDIRLPRGPKNVAHYITKYASKPLSTSFLHDRHLLDEAVQALKGRRLCTTFGGWRGVLLVDKPDEEGWTNLGPLTDWIRKAATGDQTARDLLNQINADNTAVCMELAPLLHPRPPPDRPIAADSQQAMFTPQLTFGTANF